MHGQPGGSAQENIVPVRIGAGWAIDGIVTEAPPQTQSIILIQSGNKQDDIKTKHAVRQHVQSYPQLPQTAGNLRAIPARTLRYHPSSVTVTHKPTHQQPHHPSYRLHPVYSAILHKSKQIGDQ